MRNACFCSSRPPILALKIHPKIMFFQDAFLDTIFVDFMLVLYENARFGDPFKIQWAPKSNPKSTKWRPKPYLFIFGRSTFSSPGFVLHFGRPLAQCWTLLVPIGYLLLHFRYHFSMIFHVFSTDLWTDHCKTCPLTRRLKRCHTSAKICQNLPN